MWSRLTILLRTMRGARRHYAAAAVAVVFAAFFGYVSPFVLRFTIDSVIGDKPARFPDIVPVAPPGPDALAFLQDNLWLCGLLMVGFTALQGVFTVVRRICASRASERMAERLRNRLYDHISRLPYLVQDAVGTGDVIQRCSSDMETVRLFVETQAIEVWRILMMVVIAIPLMLSLDPGMTLAATFLLPVVMVCSVVYFLKVKARFQASVEMEAEVTTVAQENLVGVRLVRAFQRQEYEIGKFASVNAGFRDRVRDMIRVVSLFWAFTAFLCMAQIVFTLAFGTVRVAEGTLTLGTLTVFVTYVGMLVWPIRLLGHVLSDLGRSYVSLGRILQVLDQPTEAAGDTGRRPPIRGRIEFENVGYRYENAGPPSLSGISFSVTPGQTIAIVGRTGSGKSTLIHLIPRLLDYTEGSIRIDGVELRDIDRKWIRRHGGIVLQEPFLFSRSVRENIALGGGDEVSDREILEVAELAAIHETIQHTFSEGYRTLVGERGATLSGGQRQRIAIARAILSNPPILILDDSLSAVDAQTVACI